MSNIICIVGKKRSGKDTVADFIKEELGFETYKLAYPIKDAIVYACPELTFEDLDGEGVDREKSLGYNSSQVVKILRACLDYHNLKFRDLEEFVESYDESSWSIRTLMQRFGTDLVCNKIDQMFWTNLAVKETINNNTSFIIPDIRQGWELSTFRDYRCLIIHVTRDNMVVEDSHSTEKGLPISVGDCVISNDGSLEELKNKVKLILKGI